MSTFEERWEESYQGVCESNKKNFGVLSDVMNQTYREFKPLMKLFYEQGAEDFLEKNKMSCVDLIDSKINFE